MRDVIKVLVDAIKNEWKFLVNDSVDYMLNKGTEKSIRECLKRKRSIYE